MVQKKVRQNSENCKTYGHKLVVGNDNVSFWSLRGRTQIKILVMLRYFDSLKVFVVRLGSLHFRVISKGSLEVDRVVFNFN